MEIPFEHKENSDFSWILLYDGECSLCIRFAGFISRFDKKHEIFPIPLQKYIETDDSITYDDLMKDVHLLGVNGEVLTGAAAVNMILQIVPAAGPYRWMMKTKAGEKLSKAAYMTLKIIRGCPSCGRQYKFGR
ncbi:MAG: DUF393 domain-containing protein [Spirochaetes bacterium]|nr:DUF393 domain-containing protein [Spirochaetota bacterium]